MRRRTLVAMALVFAATPAPGLDLAEIKAKGVLRVIAAADEAPETFSFEGGPNPGIDRELAEGFARLHGLRLEAVKAKSYADRIPALTRGEGDVIVAIFDTEDRRKLVDFTVEIMPTHSVAVMLEPRKAVGAIDDLKALRVGAGVTVGPTGKVAWAVRKQYAALRSALDDYLTNVRRSPSWGRLIVKYFGDQALQVLGRAK